MYNMSGDSKCRGKNLNEPGTETCRETGSVTLL